jgi:hypothetical protein
MYGWPWKHGRSVFGLFGGYGPFDATHERITRNLGADADAMRRDARTVADWDFERIIPCHGVSTSHCVCAHCTQCPAGRHREGRQQGLARCVQVLAAVSGALSFWTFERTICVSVPHDYVNGGLHSVARAARGSRLG